MFLAEAVADAAGFAAGHGAVVGAVGNHMMSKRIVQNARQAFGTAPARWPGTTLRVLPAVGDGDGN